MKQQIDSALGNLRCANPGIGRSPTASGRHRLRKVLVANRGEIAKRFFFALREEGIPSVAVVTDPDRKQSWYEFADEVVYIGEPAGYTDMPTVLAAALLSGATAIYPGYGFLSENHRFVEAIDRLRETHGRVLCFMGPSAEVMRKVGHKLDARALARANGVPLLEGTGLIASPEQARGEAARVGYPVIVKLNAGGGGKGMAVARSPEGLVQICESARRIGKANYGDDSLYLERYIERPVHLEVQIFNGMAVGIRKCAVQRNNQKIIEESGDHFLNDRLILKLLAAAENVAAISGYAAGGGAGTVEFLLDVDSEEFGFLEVNTRLQVEYPVTDQSLHIDLVKWQILLFDGREDEIPYERARRLRFAEKDHAIECRIYAEDPWNGYAPSPGIIRELDLPTFNGVRCDVGFKTGDSVLPHYDPMIGKIIAYGRNRGECLARLERALGEVYVRGITTNVDQLLEILRHPSFRDGRYTNRLLDESTELFTPQPGARRSVIAAVFASLAEMVHAVHATLEAALANGDLESILQRGTLNLVPAFHAEIHGKRLRIDFLQHGPRTYAAFVNRAYLGEMQVVQRIDGSSDCLILYQGRSYPVRVDRRPSHHALRVMEEGGIHYYRVRVREAGSSQATDPPGAVRCPFQGSFVKLAGTAGGGELGIGSQVRRGDPLMVIEAMKMESTLLAPVTGKVTYLVEDGVQERLVRGRTSQGLVLGKPLAEGELLVVVEEASAAPQACCEYDPIDIEGEPHEVFGHILDAGSTDGGLAAAVAGNPGVALPIVLRLVRSHCLGYLQGEEIPQRLTRCMEALAASGVPLENVEEAVADIVETYALLKQIYSPALGVNQTWFGEMNRLVLEWENETYSPPPLFRSVMARLRQKYGIPRMDGKRSPEMRLALFHLLRGYDAVREGRALIGSLLRLLLAGSLVPRRSRTALIALVRQEQPERDDALATLGRVLLARPAGAGRSGGSRHRAAGADKPAGKAGRHGLAGTEGDDFREQARAALRTPAADPIPRSLPDWVRRELEKRAQVWSRSYRIERLPSSMPAVVQYRLVPHEGGAHRYATVAWLEEGVPEIETDGRGRVRSASNVERAAVQAGRLLTAYNDLDEGEHNIVLILACERPIDLDLAGSDPGVLNYESLVEIAGRPVRFFLHSRADFVLVQVSARRPGSMAVERKVINVHLNHGRVCLDLLHVEDERNPLWNGASNARDQRLFDQGKWPLEYWVQECLDPGTAREILIASIDGTRTAGDEAQRKAVGARIYEGLIAGAPAVFFCKDSRISGGATGDLEGRKYVAACYYAYMRDVPLYVWNDGAGANVRQGMVALNRAAEGFMMNALTAHGVGYARFLATVRSVGDPVLGDLFRELEQAFDLSPPPNGVRAPRNFVSVAVGVGSATGLDVYGSSQACIQIMLDSGQSYRVLTGSNVIRAVTGESLSNYEIGGARVMAQWTGTVDLVARDRIDLLRHVRRVHALFSGRRHDPVIARSPDCREVAEDGFADTVLNERRIAANVDRGTFVPFKSEYVEAGALVGGFARLGGKHVLVMGPRTDAGVRSFASLVRTRELLRIADRTRSPKILVVGRRWYRAVGGEDENAVRAQMDLARQLARPGTPRIHIVTRPEGLLLVTLNSQADATIYVRRKQDSEKDRRVALKTATFQTESLGEAFDLANRVLGFFDGEAGPAVFDPPRKAPRIPVDPSQPFDMVADVIEAIFDEGSFLEFHRDPEDRPGSTLITGLGTLEGRVIGVIADQPLGGGAPDAPGTEKFRLFMEFLERHRFPLVMLSNAPGFVPGTKQERLRIQQIGGESLDVNVLSSVPVVSVVLNQNFGGRQIHAFSRFLRPGVAYIALSRATLAVMGASAAFDLFHGARYRELAARSEQAEADRMRNEFLDAFNRKARADGDAMATGVLDWTIRETADLRAEILRAMEVARTRMVEVESRNRVENE